MTCASLRALAVEPSEQRGGRGDIPVSGTLSDRPTTSGNLRVASLAARNGPTATSKTTTSTSSRQQITGRLMAFAAERGDYFNWVSVQAETLLVARCMVARHDNRSPELGTSVSITVRPGRRTVSV